MFLLPHSLVFIILACAEDTSSLPWPAREDSHEPWLEQQGEVDYVKGEG